MSLHNRKIRIDSLQDIVFLAGIIIFSSVLVIGLFPGRIDAGLIDEDFFITTLMTIPVITGIYFIVISFRRNLNVESLDIRHSIKKKITMAFVFIAVLSALPIVIISSNYFTSTLSKMFSGKTMEALEKSDEMIHGYYSSISDEIRTELEAARIFISESGVLISDMSLGHIVKGYDSKELNAVFILHRPGSDRVIENSLAAHSGLAADISAFYKDMANGKARQDRIMSRGHDLISGAFASKRVTVILWKDIPQSMKSMETVFLEARAEYLEVEKRKSYFESGEGSFLMFLSILIIALAYLISLYMSGTITRPLLELSSASKEIAAGNYTTNLVRSSDDEIGVLMDSFNRMAGQLEENRKVMFQKQKLEAWNEMARRLVHEIKNPLTPIRLSAERMRRLTADGNPARDEAVMTGTETIISEVSSLLKLVGEFNTFARLPGKNAEPAGINRLISESALLFGAHDNIEFRLELDESIPDIPLDRGLMRQALNNLIINAVQAINGRGVVTLGTRLEPGGDEVIISVNDTGAGIPEADIEKIFEPGFTSKRSGSGLGLAIVEKIVFEHDGRITCRSAVGEGTTFEIKLPVVGEVNNG